MSTWCIRFSLLVTDASLFPGLPDLLLFVLVALFAPVLAGLRDLVEQTLEPLEAEMEAAGAPWTPGRMPTWQPE